MHIVKISSNVKGGGQYELGARTLVVGRNGAGKSGLLAAIELVLAGRSTEIGALPAELLALAPDGQPLHVEASLSDGRTVVFDVEGTTARAKRACWTLWVVAHWLKNGIGTDPMRCARRLGPTHCEHLKAAFAGSSRKRCRPQSGRSSSGPIGRWPAMCVSVCSFSTGASPSAG